jgi:hypothetical protein
VSIKGARVGRDVGFLVYVHVLGFFLFESWPTIRAMGCVIIVSTPMTHGDFSRGATFPDGLTHLSQAFSFL